MRIGFGLDLAGYATGKTVLSVVEKRQDSACATLLTGTVFSSRHHSDSPLRPIVDEEASILRACLERGPVAVDVPIDLRGLFLMGGELPQKIWGLTCRPIDKKLGALRALADRLGSPVARFNAIMSIGDFDESLGAQLFETYPAASLKAMGCDIRNYKQASETGRQARIRVCKELRLAHASEINDDEIDSIVCAMTALEPDDKFPLPSNEMPKGYRLLRHSPFPFERITLKTADFSEWMGGAAK